MRLNRSKSKQNLAFILLITLIFISCKASKIDYNYLKSEDFVIWRSDRSLKWADFKGRYGFTNHAAEIFWGISYIKDDNAQWNIFAHFNKRKSWYQIDSDHVLRHEQYHFNLAEVYARKIRKEIIFKNISLGSSAFFKMFNDHIQECRDMQSRYDDETKHSINQPQQTSWEQLIDKQLDVLKDYSTITIK